MFSFRSVNKIAALFIVLALGVPACQDHHYIAYDKVKEHPEIETLPPVQRGRIRDNTTTAGFSGTIAAGQVLLDSSVGDLPESATLFVIVRSAVEIIAVGADPNVKFPYTFLLNDVNVMTDNIDPKAKIMVDVRLDGDGNASTKDDGDLYGQISGEVDFGAEGLVVTLKKGPPADNEAGI